MARVRVEFNDKGWEQMIDQIISTDGVKRMERVADACNSADLSDRADPDEQNGYRVSTEGSGPHLTLKDRATVITATAPAMAENAAHNSLVQNFHLASD